MESEIDDALTKMLKAKPEPRKKIKTQGRRGPKTPVLAKPELLVRQGHFLQDALERGIEHLHCSRGD